MTTDITFLTGLLGSLILITGAAWPDTKTSHPARSLKNWLFAIGGFVMLIYALLNYQNGGPIFFVILQLLVNISSVFMMLNTSDKIDVPIIGLSGTALIVWSLYLFEGYNTVFFIIGLSGIGIGYVLDAGSLKRSAALTIGSTLIALFSYIEHSWIFFWLNVFFALFSVYGGWKLQQSTKQAKK